MCFKIVLNTYVLWLSRPPRQWTHNHVVPTQSSRVLDIVWRFVQTRALLKGFRQNMWHLSHSARRKKNINIYTYHPIWALHVF